MPEFSCKILKDLNLIMLSINPGSEGQIDVALKPSDLVVLRRVLSDAGFDYHHATGRTLDEPVCK